MTLEKAIGYGYVIADSDGRVQLHTFRSNRHDCWQALLGETASPKMRARYKRLGFRCVPGYFKEIQL